AKAVEKHDRGAVFRRPVLTIGAAVDERKRFDAGLDVHGVNPGCAGLADQYAIRDLVLGGRSPSPWAVLPSAHAASWDLCHSVARSARGSSPGATFCVRLDSTKRPGDGILNRFKSGGRLGDRSVVSR